MSYEDIVEAQTNRDAKAAGRISKRKSALTAGQKRRFTFSRSGKGLKRKSELWGWRIIARFCILIELLKVISYVDFALCNHVGNSIYDDLRFGMNQVYFKVVNLTY